MQEFFISVLDFLGRAWWVEIKTETPRCTYYFGPFLSAAEAQAAKSGYLDDLEQEGAVGISVDIKRCKPTKLTIFDELGEAGSQRFSGALSGQF